MSFIMHLHVRYFASSSTIAVTCLGSGVMDEWRWEVLNVAGSVGCHAVLYGRSSPQAGVWECARFRQQLPRCISSCQHAILPPHVAALHQSGMSSCSNTQRHAPGLVHLDALQL